MQNRQKYLDAYRGIFVIWVIIVHISLNYGYIHYGEPSGKYSLFSLLFFYMFTFYFSAGYLFKPNRSFKDLVIRKTRRLIVPWVLYTLFGIIIYSLYCFVTHQPIKLYFSSILYSWALSSNTPMWFLMSLFCSTICTWVLINKSNIFKGGAAFATILLLIVILLIPNKHFLFGIQNILLGTFVMSIGNAYRQAEKALSNSIVLLASAIAFIVMWLFYPCEYWFDRNVIGQGNIVLIVCFGLLGSYISFNIVKGLSDIIIIKPFEWIGKYSLALFAFHRPVLNFIIDPILGRILPDCGFSIHLLASIAFLAISYFLFLTFAKKHCRILL